MYNHHVAGPGAAGALAATGSQSLWIALSAFALTSAGFALLRLIPRRGH